MWNDQHLKHTLQMEFRINVELARVLDETLKIVVNTKHCKSVKELISESLLPKLCGTIIIFVDCYEKPQTLCVTDRKVPKILRPCFSFAIVDNTVLPRK